jgi:hypothetical protein
MNRLLLCIGCNEYHSSNLPALNGAIPDAQGIYTLLVDPQYGEYHSTNSILIRNPNISDVSAALRKILFQYGDIDVFSLFFAGHGVAKDGAYYLCVKDSEINSLSMSALATADIFKAINEAKPKQSNIIIDACESGAVVSDIGSLLKPEIIGGANTPAITIFATSASNQLALENTSGGTLGGVGTKELMSYIRGEKIVQNTRPYLDLSEIGRVASLSIENNKSQSPNVWGLNLCGEALFTKNLNFTGDTLNFSFALTKTPAQSGIGQIIQEKAASLWGVYAELSKRTDNEKLFEVLNDVCGKVASGSNYASSFISGIAPNLVSEATKSNDLFSANQVLAVCISVLLAYSEKEPEANKVINLLISEWLVENRRSFTKLNEISLATPYGLLSESGGLSDLYYLPIRISKILGWLGAHIIISQSLGISTGSDTIIAKEIIDKILNEYAPSIVAMSDIQSPYISLIYEACRRLELKEQAELHIGLMFNSFVEHGGKIASADIEAKRILQYLLCRDIRDFSGFYSLVANPSNFLSTLFLGTKTFGLEEVVDPYMRKLDHLHFNLFVPRNHRDFGIDVIREGMNFSFQVGHEIFTVADFISAYNSRINPEIAKDTSLNSPIIRAACIIASMIFPDRVAWFSLEGLDS